MLDVKFMVNFSFLRIVKGKIYIVIFVLIDNCVFFREFVDVKVSVV